MQIYAEAERRSKACFDYAEARPYIGRQPNCAEAERRSKACFDYAEAHLVSPKSKYARKPGKGAPKDDFRQSIFGRAHSSVDSL